MHEIALMKRIGVCFWFLVFRSFISAQSVSVVFTDSTQWQIAGMDNDPGICNGYYRFHTSTLGDTVINSSTYLKLYGYTDLVSGSPPCYFALPSIGYKGALRDDTTAKKVFYIFPSENVDSLLFDYNLVIGDAVKGVLFASVCSNGWVSSIDSVLINALYHKRWNLTDCGGGVAYIIEGIGSNFGLLESIGSHMDSGTELICVSDVSGTIYNSGSGMGSCYVSVKEIYSGDIVFKVYPNPSSDYIKVEIKLSDETQKGQLIVYNILGAEIFKQNVLNTDILTINIDEYNNGIYFFVLSTEVGVIEKEKIIITK